VKDKGYSNFMKEKPEKGELRRCRHLTFGHESGGSEQLHPCRCFLLKSLVTTSLLQSSSVSFFLDNKLRELQWPWQYKGREKNNVLCVKDRKLNVAEKDSKN
jgi:hypothetical protein